MAESVFTRIRATVGLDDVLARYGIPYPAGKTTFRLRCPFHDGDDANFAVDLARHTWRCFSACGEGGDVIAFVAKQEGIGQWKAAAMLAEWFSAGTPRAIAKPPPPKPPTPIAWTLTLEQSHEALAALGVEQETASTFGIGYRHAGYFGKRVCFPVEDPLGRAIGYIGRATEQGQEPKYLLGRGLHKGFTLYNLHRVTTPFVILVEGPRDVWALHRAGLPVVSPLGSSLTCHQATLLARFREVLVLFDGDGPGRRGARDAVQLLAPSSWVRVLDMPEETDPASLDSGEMDRLLAQAQFPRQR